MIFKDSNSNVWYYQLFIFSDKNSAEGYVALGKEHVLVTYNCNSYS